MAGQNIDRLEEIYIERVGGVKEMTCSCRRRKTPRTFTSKAQPHGDTQMNRNGLIEDDRVILKEVLANRPKNM